GGASGPAARGAGGKRVRHGADQRDHAARLVRQGRGGSARPSPGRPHGGPGPRATGGGRRGDQLDPGGLILFRLARLGGWRLGFLARVFSWFGLALGVYLASQLLPAALRAISSSDAAYRAAVAVLILLGGAFAGQALGLMAGLRIHRVLPIGPIRLIDR